MATFKPPHLAPYFAFHSTPVSVETPLPGVPLKFTFGATSSSTVGANNATPHVPTSFSVRTTSPKFTFSATAMPTAAASAIPTAAASAIPTATVTISSPSFDTINAIPSTMPLSFSFGASKNTPEKTPGVINSSSPSFIFGGNEVSHTPVMAMPTFIFNATGTTAPPPASFDSPAYNAPIFVFKANAANQATVTSSTPPLIAPLYAALSACVIEDTPTPMDTTDSDTPTPMDTTDSESVRTPFIFKAYVIPSPKQSSTPACNISPLSTSALLPRFIFKGDSTTATTATAPFAFSGVSPLKFTFDTKTTPLPATAATEASHFFGGTNSDPEILKPVGTASLFTFKATSTPTTAQGYMPPVGSPSLSQAGTALPMYPPTEVPSPPVSRSFIFKAKNTTPTSVLQHKSKIAYSNGSDDDSMRCASSTNTDSTSNSNSNNTGRGSSNSTNFVNSGVKGNSSNDHGNSSITGSGGSNTSKVWEYSIGKNTKHLPRDQQLPRANIPDPPISPPSKTAHFSRVAHDIHTWILSRKSGVLSSGNTGELCSCDMPLVYQAFPLMATGIKNYGTKLFFLLFPDIFKFYSVGLSWSVVCIEVSKTSSRKQAKTTVSSPPKATPPKATPPKATAPTTTAPTTTAPTTTAPKATAPKATATTAPKATATTTTATTTTAPTTTAPKTTAPTTTAPTTTAPTTTAPKATATSAPTQVATDRSHTAHTLHKPAKNTSVPVFHYASGSNAALPPASPCTRPESAPDAKALGNAHYQAKEYLLALAMYDKAIGIMDVSFYFQGV